MSDALSFLEEDLTCLICCDIFTDPVTLKCSHSLCSECLQRFWTTQEVPQCPVCRKECSHDEPTKSLAFKALCESFKSGKLRAVSGDVCPLHKEALKLFCYDDKQPICVVCYTSKKHENHKCSPVEEAVEDLKVGEVWNLIWLSFGVFKLIIKSLIKSLWFQENVKEQMDKMQVILDDHKKAHKSCVEKAELIKVCG